ncbi:MAG: hypothetical protein R3D88_06180 [Alphaproteobacteria bacterium]
MTQRMEDIAKRIIVCGAEEIGEHLKAGEIGAIVSVDSSSEESLKFQDIEIADHIDRIVLKELDKYRSGSEFEKQISCINTMQENFGKLEELLVLHQGKKIIIHCAAGAGRSPQFMLMFLLHLQGGAENIDKALEALHAIRPNSAIGVSFWFYQDYLGGRYDTYFQAVIDYRTASSLAKCRTQADIDKCLSYEFNYNAPEEPDKMEQFVRRFGLKLQVLAL